MHMNIVANQWFQIHVVPYACVYGKNGLLACKCVNGYTLVDLTFNTIT